MPIRWGSLTASKLEGWKRGTKQGWEVRGTGEAGRGKNDLERHRNEGKYGEVRIYL